MSAAGRGRLLLFAGAALGLALAGRGLLAPDAATLRPGPGEFARVNGIPISNAELERALARIEADTRVPRAEEARRHVRERLIDDELLVQRGVALGLAGSEPNVRKAIVSALIASVVADASSAAPAEGELEAFFAAHPGYFAAAGRVRVARIFVRDGEGADARISEVLSALDGGVGPGEVSERYGDATPLALPDALLPEAKLRELLGPTQAALAFALSPGTHSAALADVGGRTVLVSLEREPGVLPDFEVVRPQVEAEWTRRAGERALAAYLELLRREAEIRISAEPPR